MLKLKLVNPLYYPIAVLIGGIILVVGVRFLQLPNFAVLPTSIALSTVTAAVLKAREPDGNIKVMQELQKELQEIDQSVQDLVQKAKILQADAKQLLVQQDFQLNLLLEIEEVCNYVMELPGKIKNIAKNIVNIKSLLSIDELQQKLSQVQNKIVKSSGDSRRQLEKLAASLQRNIELAKTGTDTRQAQILNLHTIVEDASGVLQELQNKIRTADLSDSEKIHELSSLTEALKNQEKQVDLYLTQ